MNETINTILSRRSVRGFKTEQIKKEDLDIIIECGLSAPSAMNRQNWHFTVIQKPELIDWINAQIKQSLPDAARERYMERNNGDENFSMFYNAPTIIFVSGPGNENSAAVNGSLATQNICLAAESLGLGTCIIGLANLLFETPKRAEYIKELGMPDGYMSLHAIAVGYKNMEISKPHRMPDKVNYIV